MKRVLMILSLGVIIWSCGTGEEDPIPELTEAVGEFTVSGAKSTTSTEDYPVEIVYLAQGSGETAISSLQVAIGNIGQTNDVIVITLSELGNGDGFQSTTYNYTVDVNANLQLIAYYADDNDVWQIYDQAANLTNKISLTSISDSKAKGTFEFNFQAATGTDLVKITGSFDGPNSLLD